MITQETLAKRIANYKSLVESPILEKCNFIIEVGFMTAGTDNGTLKLERIEFPEQFTEKIAKDIEANAKFSNGAKPQLFLAKDWYKKEIAEMENTLQLLQ